MDLAASERIAGSLVGAAASTAALFGIYLGTLTLLSGWDFAASQFAEFWPYIVALSLGFGAQVGLFLQMRQLAADHHHAHHMLAASGTTSTAAMLACCTHYVANFVPLLGTVGLVTLVAQYQSELFWIGLAFNAAGLAYLASRLRVTRNALAGGHAC